MKYFVAEVSMFEGNPKHTVIVRTLPCNYYELWGSTNIYVRREDGFHYFKLIREIDMEVPTS